MKFALVNEERKEAATGLAGHCQGCGKLMVSKCGKIKFIIGLSKEIGKCNLCWEVKLIDTVHRKISFQQTARSLIPFAFYQT